MSSDAERDWQAYAARTGVPKPIRGTQDWNTERSAFKAGHQAGAEWERSRPVTDAEVEAAVAAVNRLDWGAQHGGVDPDCVDIARAALEAAAKVRAQGESEHASHEFCDPTLGCVEGGTE